MAISYSGRCSSTIMMKNTRLVLQLGLSQSISQSYKPLKSHKSALPIFRSEKLILNLRLMPQNNTFYSYKETLAKKGKKDPTYPFQGISGATTPWLGAAALSLWTKWSTESRGNRSTESGFPTIFRDFCSIFPTVIMTSWLSGSISKEEISNSQLVAGGVRNRWRPLSMFYLGVKLLKRIGPKHLGGFQWITSRATL